MSKANDSYSEADQANVTPRPSLQQLFGLTGYQFSAAKWAALVLAGIMVTLGLAFSSGSGLAGSAATRSSAADTGLLGSSFAQSNPTAPNGSDTAPAPTGDDVRDAWSGFLVKGGFGLFLGFAIGFAIRAFLRLALIMVGFYVLLLTLMAYAGWVEIHWDIMEQQFNHTVATLGEQVTSFKAFLSGILPASGMAALGLALGLRKR